VVELVKALVRRSRLFIRVTEARIVGYRSRGHIIQAFFMGTLLASHFQLGAWGLLGALVDEYLLNGNG